MANPTASPSPVDQDASLTLTVDEPSVAGTLAYKWGTTSGGNNLGTTRTVSGSGGNFTGSTGSRTYYVTVTHTLDGCPTSLTKSVTVTVNSSCPSISNTITVTASDNSVTQGVGVDLSNSISSGNYTLVDRTWEITGDPDFFDQYGSNSGNYKFYSSTTGEYTVTCTATLKNKANEACTLSVVRSQTITVSSAPAGCPSEIPGTSISTSSSSHKIDVLINHNTLYTAGYSFTYDWNYINKTDLACGRRTDRNTTYFHDYTTKHAYLQGTNSSIKGNNYFQCTVTASYSSCPVLTKIYCDYDYLN